MKLVEGFDSNYRYVLVAARRARQLQNGAPPGCDQNITIITVESFYQLHASLRSRV